MSFKDEKLFSVFSSRLSDKKRKDMKDILKKYGLEKYDEDIFRGITVKV